MRPSPSWFNRARRILAVHVERLGDTLIATTQRLRETVAQAVSNNLAGAIREAVHALFTDSEPSRTRPVPIRSPRTVHVLRGASRIAMTARTSTATHPPRTGPTNPREAGANARPNRPCPWPRRTHNRFASAGTEPSPLVVKLPHGGCAGKPVVRQFWRQPGLAFSPAAPPTSPASDWPNPP